VTALAAGCTWQLLSLLMGAAAWILGCLLLVLLLHSLWVLLQLDLLQPAPAAT
jgi:hypothetical protein